MSSETTIKGGAASGPAKFRLLLVAADEVLRFTLAALVAEGNRSLAVAGSVSEAVALAAQEAPFDLLLVDATLPDGSGFELMSTLREHTPEIEAIVLANQASLADAVQAVRLQAFDYIEQPLDAGAHIELVVKGALRKLGIRRQQRNLLTELSNRDERVRLVARATGIGIWDHNLKTNEFYYSEGFRKMLGLDPNEPLIGPDAWFRRIAPSELPWVKRELDKLREGSARHVTLEYQLFNPGSGPRWMRCQAIAEEGLKGPPDRVVGGQIDITEYKGMSLQLAHDALHDSLTRLPNRALFMDRLARALARQKQEPSREFSVLLLDLDRFKNVNESLGPGSGDRLLVVIADRLRQCVDGAHTLARMGGDEFAVLFEEGAGSDTVAATLTSIEAALRLPIDMGHQHVTITCSSGIAIGSPDYISADAVLADADTAMYKAKELGGGSHEVFVGTMRESVEQQMRLETALWQAVQERHIDVAYQPILSLHPLQLVGFEALVRWKHESMGRISPVDFIPLAERTGAIISLGESVLEESCRMISRCCAETGHELYVSVNLSPRQLLSPNLIQRFSSIVDATGGAPESVRLEITEGALVSDMERTLSILQGLTAIGFRLSLDDFGTGYSSLSYLLKLPFSTLKIDRSFVVDALNGERNRRLVAAIVNMARALHLDTIAEGIENQEQLSLLRELGCGYGQGYLLSKPLTRSGAIELAQRVSKAGGWRVPSESEPLPRSISQTQYSKKTLHALNLLRSLASQPPPDPAAAEGAKRE